MAEFHYCHFKATAKAQGDDSYSTAAHAEVAASAQRLLTAGGLLPDAFDAAVLVATIAAIIFGSNN